MSRVCFLRICIVVPLLFPAHLGAASICGSAPSPQSGGLATLICSSITGIYLAKLLCSLTSHVSSSSFVSVIVWGKRRFWDILRLEAALNITTPTSDNPAVIAATIISVTSCLPKNGRRISSAPAWTTGQPECVICVKSGPMKT